MTNPTQPGETPFLPPSNEVQDAASIDDLIIGLVEVFGSDGKDISDPIQRIGHGVLVAFRHGVQKERAAVTEHFGE